MQDKIIDQHQICICVAALGYESRSGDRRAISIKSNIGGIYCVCVGVVFVFAWMCVGFMKNSHSLKNKAVPQSAAVYVF